MGPWRAPKFSSRRGKKKTKAVEKEGNRKVKEGKMEKGKEICGWFWVGRCDDIGKDCIR